MRAQQRRPRRQARKAASVQAGGQLGLHRAASVNAPPGIEPHAGLTRTQRTGENPSWQREVRQAQTGPARQGLGDRRLPAAAPGDARFEPGCVAPVGWRQRGIKDRRVQHGEVSASKQDTLRSLRQTRCGPGVVERPQHHECCLALQLVLPVRVLGITGAPGLGKT